MRLLAFLLFSSAFLSAQVPACDQTNLAPGNDARPCQTVINYNGSNQVTSICYAFSVEANVRPRTAVAISAATQASPVAFTSTNHGFPIGSRPSVTVKGGTGNWTGANVTAVATIIDANTFSIPVDSGAFGAVTGTLTFTTTGPRLTVSEWATKLFQYDANGNVINSAWVGGSTALRNLCSGTALTTGNAQ